jgi:hypothetical protein
VASPDHVDGLRALLDDNMEHLRAMAANALARFEPSVRGAADVHALALRAATDLSASVFDKIHWLSPDEREAAHREVHARYAPVVRDLEAMPSGPGLDEMAVEMLHNLPPDVRNCLPPPSFIAALVARGQFPENRQLRGEVQNIFRTLLQNADSPPSRKVTAADVAMLKESMRVMWRRPDDWGSTLQLVEGILRKLEPPTFTGA